MTLSLDLLFCSKNLLQVIKKQEQDDMGQERTAGMQESACGINFADSGMGK